MRVLGFKTSTTPSPMMHQSSLKVEIRELHQKSRHSYQIRERERQRERELLIITKLKGSFATLFCKVCRTTFDLKRVTMVHKGKLQPGAHQRIIFSRSLRSRGSLVDLGASLTRHKGKVKITHKVT